MPKKETENEAIEPDDDGGIPTPEERLDSLEALAEKANSDREDQMVPVDEDIDEPDETEEGEDTVESEEEEPEDEVQTDEEEPDESSDEELVEVVVDGVKQKVPLSDILDAGKRTYQKETAADQRLREAHELLKRAEVQPEKEVDPAQVALETAQERLKTAREKYAEAAAGVEEDEISSALEEWEAANREVWKLENRQPSVEEIEARVSTRLSAKAIQARFEDPPEEGGLSDIVADPRAQMLAAMEVDRLVKEEGKDPNVWSTYQSAAESTRTYLGWTNEKQDGGFEEKREKKKKVVNIRSAHKDTPKFVDETKPKTRAELNAAGLQELMKARGQT